MRIAGTPNPGLEVYVFLPSLAKLAALLGELGFEHEPVKTSRSTLVNVLLKERKRFSHDTAFKKRIERTFRAKIQKKNQDILRGILASGYITIQKSKSLEFGVIF